MSRYPWTQNVGYRITFLVAVIWFVLVSNGHARERGGDPDQSDRVLAIAASVIALDSEKDTVVWTNPGTGHQGWSVRKRAFEGRRCWGLGVGVTLPFVADSTYSACRTGNRKSVFTVSLENYPDTVSVLELKPIRTVQISPCDVVWVRGSVDGKPYDATTRLCRTGSGLTVGPMRETDGSEDEPVTQDRWVEQMFDTRRKLVGRIYRRSGGILEARDAKHRIVGTYDPTTGQTRDGRRQLVAYGNVLSHLIMMAGPR